MLRTLGIQTSTSSSTHLSTSTTRFIPTSQIQDIFIHEAFKGFEVRYYLAVVVQGEGEVIVVFPVCFGPFSTHTPSKLTKILRHYYPGWRLWRKSGEAPEPACLSLVPVRTQETPKPHSHCPFGQNARGTWLQTMHQHAIKGMLGN